MNVFNVGDKVVCIGRKDDGTRLPSYGKRGHIIRIKYPNHRVVFEDRTENVLFPYDMAPLTCPEEFSWQEGFAKTYTTVLGNCLQMLEDKVNEKMREGWEPVGGITLQSSKSTNDTYIQAMVQMYIPREEGL